MMQRYISSLASTRVSAVQAEHALFSLGLSAAALQLHLSHKLARQACCELFVFVCLFARVCLYAVHVLLPLPPVPQHSWRGKATANPRTQS